MPPTAARIDPYANFNFRVEIDGITRAGFHDVSGLESTVDMHTYREGGQNIMEMKLPMMAKTANLVFKWGLADDLELYTWHLTIVNGTVDRRNGSVIVLDRQGNDKSRWNFFNAWPAKYVGPTLNAEGNDIAIETLELAHERIERVK